MGQKFWFFLLIGPLVAMLSPFLLGKKGGLTQVLLLSGFSFLLSVFCLVFANQPGWIDKDTFEKFKPWDNDNTKFEGREDPYAFIARHFVLLDNSFSKKQVPATGSTYGKDALVPITDRGKLTRVLNLLNSHEDLFDLVILDMALKDRTGDDKGLIVELNKLQDKGKLLLSCNSSDVRPDITNFPESTYGNVREEGNERTFTSHRIVDSEGKLSLPYQLYRHYKGLDLPRTHLFSTLLDERKDSIFTERCINTFITKFDISVEERLFTPAPLTIGNSLYAPMPIQLMHQAATEEGSDDLLYDLQQRRRSKDFTAVFIGAFLGPDEDVHQTMYGPMHGPVMILNNFTGLVQGQHHLSYLGIFLLSFAFFIIHYVATAQIVGNPEEPLPTKWLGGLLKAGEQRGHQWLYSSFRVTWMNGKFPFRMVFWLCRFGYLGIVFLFVEQLSVLLLVILFIAIFLLYNTILNLTILLLYFLAYQQILLYFGNDELKPRSHDRT